jgi:hypothetical protein
VKPPPKRGHLSPVPSGNGQPSPEDMAKMQQEAQHAVVQMLVGMITSLSTAAPPPQKIAEVALATLHQQEALGAVIEDAADPKKRAAHPEWGLKLKHRKTGAQGVIRVPKDLAACKTLEETLHYATIVALITNPAPRALLFAHDFDLEFFQAPASGPRIVMPG